MQRRCLVVPIAVLLVLCLQMVAHAQLELTLQPNSWTASPGENYSVQGTIRNAGSYPIWVQSMTMMYTNGLDTPFTNDYCWRFLQRTYQPGDLYTGPLFDLSIVSQQHARGSVYVGIGWAPDQEGPFVETYTYFIVHIIPEPASILALASGLGVLAFGRKRTGK